MVAINKSDDRVLGIATNDGEMIAAEVVVGDGDAGVYFRPEMGGNLPIGSLDPECDAKEFVDADNYNTALTEQWTRQV